MSSCTSCSIVMLNMRKQNTVSFADIFHYAEKYHDMHWNKCSDVFFRDLFSYKGHREIYLEEMEYELSEEADLSLSEDDKTARKVIIDFMKEKNVKKMLVLGD